MKAPPLAVHVLAGASYLAAAVFALRVVLPAPTRLVGVPVEYWDLVTKITGVPLGKVAVLDQQLAIASVVANADGITSPTHLFDNGHCYPMPNPVSLGEHMFGEGLIGAVPQRITAEPILTYNVVVIVTLWIAALTMYLLVVYLTGSSAAGFLAGLLYSFQHARLVDTSHPFVTGTHWIPLALLFAHRLVERRRWSDAAGLAVAIGLQSLESFYQLVTLAIFGLTCGGSLLVRHRRRLGTIAPKLALAAAPVAALLATMLGPYAHTKEAWGLLSGRPTFSTEWRHLGFGWPEYPGTTLLLLAVIGVLDRLRGRRSERDERWSVLLAGALCLWGAAPALPLPGTDVSIPSLWTIAGRFIWGFHAVRAASSLRFGTYLALAILSAYGIVALLERRGAVSRSLIVVGLTVAGCLEAFAPGVGRATFGSSSALQPMDMRPADKVLRAYRTTAGAVLDLPLGGAGEDLLLAAFHRHPIASCYNSYVPEVSLEVNRIAAALPSVRALDALLGLGFGSLVLHEERWRSRDAPADFRRQLEANGSKPGTGPFLLPTAVEASHRLYRLTGSVPVRASLDALRAGDEPSPSVTVVPPVWAVPFELRNGERAIYRHPDPIEPQELIVEWHDWTGAVAQTDRARMLLPIALGRGETTIRAVTVRVPPAAGEYEATLAPQTSPGLILSRRRVRVAVPDAPS